MATLPFKDRAIGFDFKTECINGLEIIIDEEGIDIAAIPMPIQRWAKLRRYLWAVEHTFLLHKLSLCRGHALLTFTSEEDLHSRYIPVLRQAHTLLGIEYQYKDKKLDYVRRLSARPFPIIVDRLEFDNAPEEVVLRSSALPRRSRTPYHNNNTVQRRQRTSAAMSSRRATNRLALRDIERNALDSHAHYNGSSSATIGNEASDTEQSEITGTMVGQDNGIKGLHGRFNMYPLWLLALALFALGARNVFRT